jgi:predicted esterase
MAHGDADGYIKLKWGKGTADRLKNFGVPVKFLTMAGMRHELVEEEIEMLRAWLQETDVFRISGQVVRRLEAAARCNS